MDFMPGSSVGFWQQAISEITQRANFTHLLRTRVAFIHNQLRLHGARLSLDMVQQKCTAQYSTDSRYCNCPEGKADRSAGK